MQYDWTHAYDVIRKEKGPILIHGAIGFKLLECQRDGSGPQVWYSVSVCCIDRQVAEIPIEHGDSRKIAIVDELFNCPKVLQCRGYEPK